ncbi:MAG: Maf family protein [Actinomycetaceae bacterium]|nr:Maf family protein [Actinomycetaceae bacterium]
MSLPRLTLLLASKSPARLATLRAAGLNPRVRVSDVDEDRVLAGVRAGAGARVLALATAKARAVSGRVPVGRDRWPEAGGKGGLDGADGAASGDSAAAEGGANAGEARAGEADGREAEPAETIVLGCDSMFEFDGQIVGKPHSRQVARERLSRMAGRSGILHTGHCLIHAGSGLQLGGVSHAVVHVARLTAEEIDAYVASGEPLGVAGSFTVDALGGPFIDRVDGDYHGVVGVSLPLLRSMMAHWDLSITQFWQRPAAGDLSERARRMLEATRRFEPKHGADGFIACSCGKVHWGLNGAGGVLAYRVRERVEILAQLRSARTHNGGTWSIPGGAIEWFETPAEGALREFREETQIGAEELVVEDEYTDEHGDWAYTTLVARCDRAEPVADYESAELRWIGLDEADGLPLHPAFATALPVLRDKVRELTAGDGAAGL